MAWLFILFADVFEVAWPFVLKWSAGFSRWSPLLAVMLFTPSAFLLAHAVFTGIATAGNGTHWNGIFGRECESRSRVFVGADRDRADRTQAVLRRDRLNEVLCVKAG